MTCPWERELGYAAYLDERISKLAWRLSTCISSASDDEAQTLTDFQDHSSREVARRKRIDNTESSVHARSGHNTLQFMGLVTIDKPLS